MALINHKNFVIISSLVIISIKNKVVVITE